MESGGRIDLTAVLPRGRETAFVSEETQNDETLEQTHIG